MRVSAPARLAAAMGTFALGCLLEPAAGMQHDDEDDASFEEEGDEDLTHDAALRACETEGDARLRCLRDANDILASEVMHETGSEAVVLPPLELHRAFGAELCGWLAEIDERGQRRACEADLELALGELMDVYLEREPYTSIPEGDFGRCRAALDDAMRWAVDDLDRTFAAAEFRQCVEDVIADAAPELGESSAVTRADDPRAALLVDDAPHVADQICILLTVREAGTLPADRVFRCHAEWQIEIFAAATGRG